MPSDRRQRRWVIRAAQASPLLALALLAAVWFSLPSRIAVFMATNVSDGDQRVTAAMRRDWMQAADAQKLSEELRLYGTKGSLNEAATGAWLRWTDSLPPRPSESDVLSPTVAPDDPVFADVAQWERATGARVWAWVVPSPPRPSVIASATGDAYSLRAARVDVEGQQVIGRDSDSDIPVPRDLDEWLWWQSGSGAGRLRPLEPGMLQIAGGGGFGGGGYQLGTYTLLSGGHVWRVLVMSEATEGETQVVEPAEVCHTSA